MFGALMLLMGATIYAPIYLPRAAALTQPTFVRSATNGTTSTVSTLTISAFNCAGGNQLLIGVVWKSSVNRVISTITANGVAATLVTSTNLAALQGHASLYSVPAPTTGDIVVTFSSTITLGIAMGAALFNGVGAVAASNQIEQASLGNSITLTTTSLSSDLVCDVFGELVSAGINITPAAGQTVIANANLATAADINLRMSTKPGSSPNTTMTWNADGAGEIMSLLTVVLNGM
jgi:hypothetical protein